MTIIETILEALNTTTDAQVAQAALSLKPASEGETVIGVVESEPARRLWALAHRYEGEADMYLHSVRYGANSTSERAAFHKLHGKAHALEEIARDLAWCEMRQQFDFWNRHAAVGLREGFTLVESPRRMRAGLLQVGAEELLRIATLATSGEPDEDEDEAAGVAGAKPS